MQSSEILSVKELSELLHLSIGTINNRLSAQRKAIESGKDANLYQVQRLAPPSIKLGRVRLFKRETVDQWLARFEGVKV
ncbi:MULTISPECIES: hypothetical protein [Pseudoalteromonas]|jgi:predicted DNA-binding transcriptional regulator AlpA|uniref:hypothetical protein n=1 Tax=Pseudoalteromonas TaxID=53246 RepID=UPI0015FABA3F|nr:MULTISPECIES: hypothetical protein [Pseudoalteromonas]MBB1380078.1 hypothetical protein [Pseudoalteromonas sp. SR43-2]